MPLTKIIFKIIIMLFDPEKKPNSTVVKNSYTAKDIEILEGLEPVRKRPGMYIGGIDQDAMHHLITEVLDNAMDEAVAGYADTISLTVSPDNLITITDNGRGIPVDNHPKFPDKSALEIILTTLHSGGKFSSDVYSTAGGLHGVGISVVNALSSFLEVKVYRDGLVYTQNYCRGQAESKLLVSNSGNKKLKGTSISFKPDTIIFGENTTFKAEKIYELAKSKAYLYGGVKIQWLCEVELGDKIPSKCIIQFPNGLSDYLESKVQISSAIAGEIFNGSVEIKPGGIKVEWAICWHDQIAFVQSFCNTIATTQGGTHEQGMRAALLRGFKAYGDSIGNKKASAITIDDILENACIVLSIFIKEPLFQGQTKEKLLSSGASKLVENIIKDHFDHWLSSKGQSAGELLEHIIDISYERLNRKNLKLVSRKSVTQKLRLPGKLTDCTRDSAIGTELFIVEGDSAGGSAKQARERETQAILPLKGKILNVASAAQDKIVANQEIQDLEIALACGSLNNYKEENLRYDKVIIMTDADVDGAHIASLLMTFFYLRMPKLITNGHLYIAKPPLYRLTQATRTYYASDDKQKEILINKLNKNSRAHIEVGRFKGLGEMTPSQLKETTMNPKSRLLYRVDIKDIEPIDKIVDDLMGKRPEKRFQFISEQALDKMDNIINNLDI